eukprot:CAMPEP_0119013116 /NCGR_PEP_ID=MMETSP1176-20130426/7955_1 /TAXON_ID=265551 /ORGANISM="Synedropsis recta cf, Strain CCMP1620" /LENGTH=281 /DNA_ID=CAMNT_0006966171 /DNA_START=14 /DNA_END=859 /DNA_ORIENTATION=+
MSSTAMKAATLFARRFSRPAVVSRVVLANRGMASMSGGQAVAQLAEQFPHMDAVRYQHKNQKFAYKDVDHYAESLACGFVEQGFQPGDIVLSWLPEHFSEQTMLQFACSKAGFLLYNLDPAQATSDPEGAKAALKKALEITNANILITQEAGSDVNYVRLCKEIIPEIRVFDFGEGMPFLSPRFPHLRYPVHTGFDHEDKDGMVPYRHMISPSGELGYLLEGKTISGATPLRGELKMGADGLPSIGKVMNNDEVDKSGVWPIYSAILKKEYQDIEGVGNVW